MLNKWIFYCCALSAEIARDGYVKYLASMTPVYSVCPNQNLNLQWHGDNDHDTFSLCTLQHDIQCWVLSEGGTSYDVQEQAYLDLQESTQHNGRVLRQQREM